MTDPRHTTAAELQGHCRLHRRIVHRHAEDAAFYWSRRMEGARASQHDLRSLARFEPLLDANLEGLRVAQHESSRFDVRGQALQPGSGGWDASWRRLKLWKTADEAFVCAMLALNESASSPRLLTQLEEMACDQFDDHGGTELPPMARGLTSAAAWMPWPAVEGAVHAWAHSCEPVLRRCSVSALALHRLPAGDALPRWLDDPHPLVRARALKAVGELGRADLVSELQHRLDVPPGDDKAHGIRNAVLASLCLLGHERAVAETASTWPATSGLGPGVAVLATWAQTASASQLGTCIDLALQDPKHWRDALAVMRFSGELRWVDVLIQVMEHQCTDAPVERFFAEPASNLARLAADVFAHITGARIGQQLWRAAPEPGGSQADDAACDPRIPVARKQDPDDGLLWPDVQAVKQWWQQRRVDFSYGRAHRGRYLAGRPLLAADVGPAAQVLVDQTATQMQRHHAALHLRCSGLTAHLFDVGASMPLQRERTAALGLEMGWV